jgi:hypothetical protein
LGHLEALDQLLQGKLGWGIVAIHIFPFFYQCLLGQRKLY